MEDIRSVKVILGEIHLMQEDLDESNTSLESRRMERDAINNDIIDLTSEIDDAMSRKKNAKLLVDHVLSEIGKLENAISEEEKALAELTVDDTRSNSRHRVARNSMSRSNSRSRSRSRSRSISSKDAKRAQITSNIKKMGDTVTQLRIEEDTNRKLEDTVIIEVDQKVVDITTELSTERERYNEAVAKVVELESVVLATTETLNTNIGNAYTIHEQAMANYNELILHAPPDQYIRTLLETNEANLQKWKEKRSRTI
jgi:chromosome segregation ATPase